ncbi:hypothetical protein LCGC14_3019320, partial [marine sediment metagenome]
MNEIYLLSQNAINKVVEFVNIGRIRFGLINHYERELLTPQKLYYFTSLYDRYSFFTEMQYLIGEILAQFQFWEQMGNNKGQLLCFIRAELYYNNIIQSKTEIRKVYSSNEFYDIPNEISEKANFTKSEGYSELKNHFQTCSIQKCPVCGGNILNLIHSFVEKVKLEIRDSPLYDAFILKLTELPYRKVEKYKELDDLRHDMDELIPLHRENFGKDRRETIRHNLNYALRSKIIDLKFYYCDVMKKKNEYKNKRKTKGILFPQIEKHIKSYKKITKNLFLILEPSLILDEVDSKIAVGFQFNKNIFKEYN